MSQKSYARGFCKYAQDNGMDPKALASFALKMAAGDLVDPIGEGMKDGAGVIDDAMSSTAERIDDAMSSIGDYADAHPILGGAALGASAPIASGAKSVGSVTAPIGAIAFSPLSVVTGPAGASSAASSGGNVAEGSAIGSAAPAMAGGAITGSVGASAGGLVGSALSPVTAPIGASAGASAGAADAEFKKRVEEERKRSEPERKRMEDLLEQHKLPDDWWEQKRKQWDEESRKREEQWKEQWNRTFQTNALDRIANGDR